MYYSHRNGIVILVPLAGPWNPFITVSRRVRYTILQGATRLQHESKLHVHVATRLQLKEHTGGNSLSNFDRTLTIFTVLLPMSLLHAIRPFLSNFLVQPWPSASPMKYSKSESRAGRISPSSKNEDCLSLHAMAMRVE